MEVASAHWKYFAYLLLAVLYCSNVFAINNSHKLLLQYEHDNQEVTTETIQFAGISIEFYNAELGNNFNFLRFGTRAYQTDYIYSNKTYHYFETMVGVRTIKSALNPYYGIGLIAGEGKKCNFQFITQDSTEPCPFGKTEIGAVFELGIQLPIYQVISFSISARKVQFLREDEDIISAVLSLNVLF